MTGIDDLPARSAELDELLDAERPVPPPPPGLEARVLAGVGAALGWGGPGGGGAAGGVGALGKAMLAMAMIGALLGGGYLVLGGRDTSSPPGRPEAAGHVDGHGLAPANAAASPDDADLPAWFGDPDPPARRIAGTGLQAGAPLASARVILTSAASAAGATSPREVVTDDAGHFDFGRRRAAIYEVSAAVAGEGEGAVRIDTRDPGAHPASDALTLVLPGCAHALVGTVRDASGGVIAGAEVRRALGPRFDARPVGAGARTDDAGTYILCAAPGPITAVVAAQGYGSVSVTDTVFGRRHLDVDLVQEAVVIGRVVDGDGATGVAGVAVSVWPASWPARRWPTPTSVISGADGRFRITGLDPGRHVLSARTGPRQSDNVPVIAGAGAETAEVVLRLGAPMVEVRGRVVEIGHAVVGATVIATLGEAAARRRLVGSPPTDE
ncbi:MAG: carboxypeptidase regulatory-like domain-containing protein, partial [Myxococcales bacterium]|nr:carboxypeptidase regulatory-like domain-containing protein [Myxococcales bacterium]